MAEEKVFYVDYHTHNNDLVRFYFNSEQDWADWNVLVLDIKQQIHDIANDGEDDDARVPKYRRWLQVVDNFRNRFGADRVPADIQSAYNSVVENIPKEEPSVEPTIEIEGRWSNPTVDKYTNKKTK